MLRKNYKKKTLLDFRFRDYSLYKKKCFHNSRVTRKWIFIGCARVLGGGTFKTLLRLIADS